MNKHLVNTLPELIKTYVDPHTIILYGSQAKGRSGLLSDYDIAVLVEEDKKTFTYTEIPNNYNIVIDAVFIPLQRVRNFLTNTSYEDKLTFKQFHKGKILCQKNNIGEQLLKKIETTIIEGPAAMSYHEKLSCINWIKKMLLRTSSDELVYKYRRHELITKLLENYFELRDLWFLGVKSSFDYLSTHEPMVYDAFEKVLTEVNASLDELVNLVIDYNREIRGIL